MLADILPHLRCIACNGGITLQKEKIQCQSCDTQYPLINGIPYIGNFTHKDLLGLMEISAVALRTNKNRETNNSKINFELLENACKTYHETADEKKVEKILGHVAPYFPHRYNEWLLLHGLLHNLELKNKQVLDVGAGSGYDAWRLTQHGAHVTALEYNLTSASVGKESLPTTTWIGGLSHIMPFQNNTFDLVFCNAALHHMRDISGAIREFLRVVKPGGHIITSCDSFSPNSYTEEELLRIFDSSPAALIGANEQAPHIQDFLVALKEQKENISCQIITTVINGEKDALQCPLEYYSQWSFDETIEKFSQSNGGLSLQIVKNKAIDLPAPIQKTTMLKADEFYTMCQQKGGAIPYLSQHIPEKYVNLPIPHSFHDKIMQLSGWRFPQPHMEWQEGYLRAYKFYKRQTTDNSLIIEINIPETGFDPLVDFSVLLNGEKAFNTTLSRGIWYKISLPIITIPDNTIFQAVFSIAVTDEFKKQLFTVRHWEFSANTITEPTAVPLNTDHRPGLNALLNTDFINTEEITMLILPGQKNLFKYFGMMRNHGIKQFNLIAPQNTAWLLQAETGATIQKTYTVSMAGLADAISNNTIDYILIPAAMPLELLIEAANKSIPCLSCIEDRIIQQTEIMAACEVKTPSVNTTMTSWLKTHLPKPLVKIIQKTKAAATAFKNT